MRMCRRSLLPGAAERKKGSAARASLAQAASAQAASGAAPTTTATRHPPSTQELAVSGGVLALQLAAGVVAGVGREVWVPPPTWWDALLSRLAAAAPDEVRTPTLLLLLAGTSWAVVCCLCRTVKSCIKSYANGFVGPGIRAMPGQLRSWLEYERTGPMC